MIKFEDVFKSYNGKSGCMCGCNGTYKLPSADLIALGNENSGWDAYDASNVSPRSVKIAVSKINKALAAGSKDANIDYDVNDQPMFAYVDDGSRNTVVYFKDYIMREIEDSRARKTLEAAKAEASNVVSLSEYKK